MGDEKRIDDFVLAEYAALREEIMWIINQVDTLERTALIFSGAIWAWTATQGWKPIYVAVVLLPFVLSILFFIKRESLRRSLQEAAAYVIKIENHFGLPEGIGWEHHLKSKRARYFWFWKLVFWTLLIIFNLVIALLMIFLNQ